ncbi:MAG: hypothetical protein IK079_06585 [Desulfovibrio sp.]|nr:hypothetical protein [Desulfovibrio sp.]
MQANVADQAFLDSLFPPERTEAFFEALFGGAEEGAYDIKLVFRQKTDQRLVMAFNLIQRPGQCLRCNLTYGLPKVFAKHPMLNVAALAQELGKTMGWSNTKWELGATEELSHELHSIPFFLTKA